MRGRPREPVFVRFITKIERLPDGCWAWHGATDGKGRPILRPGGRGNPAQSAYCIAHQLFIGPIPHGYEVDHLCNVRDCVNPDHLEAVPPEENRRRWHQHVRRKREVLRSVR